MIKSCLSILLVFALCYGLKAQQSSPYGFDTYPQFMDGKTSFGTYLAEHIQKPTNIVRDVKETLTIHLNIDSSGTASIESIYPDKPIEVTAEFAKAIADAPKWTPAKLNGNAVSGGTATVIFNVELTRSGAVMNIHPLAQARHQPGVGDVVYSDVQTPPQFIGGQYAFNRFVDKNKMYPDAAKQKKITGDVYVQFIVEKDGSLSSISVLRDPGYGLGEEAVRVLCLMPNWTPGMENKIPVRVQYVVPISFGN